jgi:hypothetical protein
VSNKVGQPSDVISAADALMLELLVEAEGLALDKRLAVVQTATRWVAVKNKLNVPEERNGFDEFREQLSGTAGAKAPGGGEREDTARSEEALIKPLGRGRRAARASERPRANGSAGA